MHKQTTPNEKKIQWHPGFCAAAAIELRTNKKELEFHREYNLSKKPLQIDLLIIEKLKDMQIENEIGKLFRGYNIIEYKSPEDSLSIDDLVKTIGYAYLYKGMGEKINAIPLEELTVSLFRDTKPKKLMKELAGYGFVIKKYTDGIYYVEGMLIPVQIIVIRELKAIEHSSLRVLTKEITRSDVRNFAEYANRLTEPGDRENVDAVLQVSVAANPEIYREVRRDIDMNALRELFKDELEDKYKEGRLEGKLEGELRGETRINLLYARLKKDGREQDILRAIEDPELCQKFFKEYGMK